MSAVKLPSVGISLPRKRSNLVCTYDSAACPPIDASIGTGRVQFKRRVYSACFDFGSSARDRASGIGWQCQSWIG